MLKVGSKLGKKEERSSKTCYSYKLGITNAIYEFIFEELKKKKVPSHRRRYNEIEIAGAKMLVVSLILLPQSFPF